VVRRQTSPFRRARAVFWEPALRRGERVLAPMPRMEPTYLAILRAAAAARAVILYPIAALTRQMTVTTYPAPTADLRDVRLVGVFFLLRATPHHPSTGRSSSVRSGLGQSRYSCGLQ
jgi:hypothetical protein